KFSELDDYLSSQLSLINGLIGVRPDRSDAPRLARVDSVIGPIAIDHAGKPSLVAPRVLADEPSDDGRRRGLVEVANEQQHQEWLAAQKAAGRDVKQEWLREGQRFFPTRSGSSGHSVVTKPFGKSGESR